MPRRSEPSTDPAVPRARSQACRSCGAPISFDEPGTDGLVRCDCGAAVPAEEV